MPRRLLPSPMPIDARGRGAWPGRRTVRCRPAAAARRFAWLVIGLMATGGLQAQTQTAPPSTAPSATAAITTTTVDESDVRVQHQGERFTIDVTMQVAVPPALAFAVMTDIAHMARFIPGIRHSEVLSQRGQTLTVRQLGVARWGPFSKTFEAVREMQLSPPSEFRTRAIGGSFKRMESVTRFEPLADGAGTRIVYHADGEPGDDFPPLIGAGIVRRQTAEQFSAMLQEMLRRR